MATSDPDRARRFARRRTDAEAPDDSLAELHAELVLLREENARLKAAEHKPGRTSTACSTRARSLSAARDDDDGDADETTKRAGRGPRDPRVAAGDLPPDRAGDGQLRGAAARAAAAARTPSAALQPPRERQRAAGTGPSRPATERERPRWRCLSSSARAAPRAPRRLALAGSRPRILLCTEGTYPYVMGGVSSWCDLLVDGLDEFDWQVLPIVAPGKREPLYTLPPQAREVGRIEVWSEDVPRGGGLRRANRLRRAARRRSSAT